MIEEWVVDTNTLLRFLLNDVPNQVSQVVDKIEKTKKGKLKLIVPQIVIFEIHFALTSEYGFSKQGVLDALKKIVSSDFLVIQDKDIFKDALDLYTDVNISLPDCFLKVYAEYSNAKLFTFDQKLLSKI